jgi:hypothetical protein
MVAARSDFLKPQQDSAPEHAFVGAWQLDRVSGLVDPASAAIGHLTLDTRSLQLELRVQHEGTLLLQAELNGESVALSLGNETYCAQALLEGEALVWELEHQAPAGCERVRRVMHRSEQGSQLIAERVDLNEAGAPMALRTEYWTRAGVTR